MSTWKSKLVTIINFKIETTWLPLNKDKQKNESMRIVELLICSIWHKLQSIHRWRSNDFGLFPKSVISFWCYICIRIKIIVFVSLISLQKMFGFLLAKKLLIIYFASLSCWLFARFINFFIRHIINSLVIQC